MRIESGSSGDERIRMAIVVVMCLGFMGWFAYDGMIRYPGKNLDWALQTMPEKPPHPRWRAKATKANLEKLLPGMTRQQLEDIAGPAALRQDRKLIFNGPEILAIVWLRDDRVTRVSSEPATATGPAERPNFLVRPEKVARIQPGMSQDQVAAELGKPATTEPETLWFIGPAAFASIRMNGDLCIGARNVREATEYSETDILGQRAIALVLVFVSAWFVFRLYKVLTLRVAVDDSGLQYNRAHIPWDAMQALRTEQYVDKGWVDLVYDEGGATRMLRLDSYRIRLFNEILKALGERKGFMLPSSPSESPTTS